MKVLILLLLMCMSVSFGQLTNICAPSVDWELSFLAGGFDPDSNFLGGTEIRSLVVFDGKLFAANGYWKDSLWRKSENGGDPFSPYLPGCQVMVLKERDGEWKQDLVLDEKIDSLTRNFPVNENDDTLNYGGYRRHLAISIMDAVTFKNYPGENGQPVFLPNSVPLLLVATWDAYDALQVEVRKSGDEPNWETSLIYQGWMWTPRWDPSYHIRGFGFHRDRVTGIDMVFAGAGKGRGIFSGVYDPDMPGSIRWGTRREKWDDESCGHCTIHHPYIDWFSDDDTDHGIGDDGPGARPGDGDRVTSFYEANDKLYATICGKIYERQDGINPRWNEIYGHPDQQCDESAGEKTFRGAVSILDQYGNEDILVGFEGVNHIGKIDLDFSSYHSELQVNEFLSNKWNNTNVGYCITAYNHITPIVLPFYLPHRKVWLIGFEAKVPDLDYWCHWRSGILMRLENAPGMPYSYELYEVTGDNIPESKLVGVRTIVPSPFAEDSGRVIYAGGFDANNNWCRNTAWICRGTLSRAPHYTPTGYSDNNTKRLKKEANHPAGTITLKIYDISGRLVKSLPSVNSIPRMDFGLANGVYFLKIESEDHTEIKKLVLVR